MYMYRDIQTSGAHTLDSGNDGKGILMEKEASAQLPSARTKGRGPLSRLGGMGAAGSKPVEDDVMGWDLCVYIYVCIHIVNTSLYRELSCIVYRS